MTEEQFRKLLVLCSNYLTLEKAIRQAYSTKITQQIQANLGLYRREIERIVDESLQDR